MALLARVPRLTATDASEVARELYAIDATAEPLPGERDQNFLLGSSPSLLLRTGKLGPDKAGDDTALGAGAELARPKFVLKIANAGDDRAVLEAQAAAAAHLTAHGVASFRVVPTTAGALIADLPPRWGGRHLVRLATWVPGATMASVPHRSRALLEDLGRQLGDVDRALASFDHPALHRDLYWDLANGIGVVGRHLALVEDAPLRSLIANTVARIEKHDAPRFARLRRSVIHNDANDHNVLVADAGELGAPQRVACLIDLGDMVHTFTIAELAIAIAYAVLDSPDPIAAAATVAGGYHKAYPLLDEEIAVLYGLVLLRLSVSVCIAADQQRQRPDDQYLSVSQDAIRRTLPALAAIPSSFAEAAFRRACDGDGLHGVGSLLQNLPNSAQILQKAPDPLLSDHLFTARRRLIGPSVRLGYREPLTIVRGRMQYLYDDKGRRYLDVYNNVPHVGHAHPRVVEAAAEQMRVLNTNTRYLQGSLVRYAERLTATLPHPLRVCYFVNSGSEANELALRLARAHTRQRDLFVLDAAYHGNTTTLVSISPYKFNGPGGEGAPPWVHVVPIPDVFRGVYKSGDDRAGEKYAAPVGAVIDELRARGLGLCGYIAESAPSVGGQIIFPSGYLDAVYRSVRAAGGVCIADEVQTAYGRLGSSWYAFEPQRVVPDIVVLGKPIGNGHPIGAVVTTAEIAASFDNGMEFFSTFGGNTVSCAAGLAVLDVMQDERLQEHALRVGEALIARLRTMGGRHDIVGDVRGSGLFLGVELVKNRETLEPASTEASTVVNRLREEGILIGTDGPSANVLKIRPPMPFDEADAEFLVDTLDRVLGEVN